MNFLQSLFTGMMFLLCLYNPFWGFCGLMSWLILGDKIGAHVNAQLFHVPIYVTEAAMVGMLLSILIQWFRQRKTIQEVQRSTPHYPVWLAYYANALVSVARGLFAYNPIRVVRDAALVYYSLFTHITARLIRSKSRLKILATVLAAATLLKMSVGITASTFALPLSSFQSAAISMYISVLLIVSLTLIPLWKKYWAFSAFICILAFSELIHWQTRSSWSGFLVFLAFWLVCGFCRIIKLRQIAQGVVLLLLGFAFHAVFYYYAVPRLTRWTAKLTEHTQAPPVVPLPPISAPPTLMHHVPKRVIVNRPPPPVPLAAQVENQKLQSLFEGNRSANVSTRFCLWIDEIEELFHIQLNYGSENRRDLYTMNRDVRGLLEQNIGPIVLDNEIKSPVGNLLVNNHLLRALNGVPFGKNFVPARLFWRMWGPTRYDPHNSHIATLYRTGVIGFCLYIFLVASGFISGFRFAYRSMDEEGRLVMVAVLGCLLFHITHSGTDVTLENSYKGAFFWVILGLVDVVRRLYSEPEPRA